MKNIEERAEQIIEYVLDNTLYDYEASDKIIKLADEFAIEFAEWLANSYYSYNFGIKMFQHRNKEIYKTTKELLEIYKKEKGL
jgi:succinylglutamate desuccinylase